jgi:type IV pilus assembly protein PilA
MNSIKCSSCGFVAWADQETCKKCGASLTAPPPETRFEQPPYPDYRPSFQQGPPRTLKQGLAIASLVFGILNFVTLGLLGLGAITGVILGVVALRKAKRRPDVYGGQGFAIAGLTTNLVWLVLALPLMAAIAIPNLLAARQAANEGAAIASLRKISAAEESYYSKRHVYATLAELSEQHLIEPNLATGVHSGYKFWVRVSSYSVTNSVPDFEATAVPADYRKSGRRSFLIDETGVIRGADIRGREASRSVRPLEDNSSSSSDDD